MAIGERIKYFRNLRGYTQKGLGMMVGFPERSADIRMAQYESGTRTPKEDLMRTLAYALDVSPSALDVPDIDSYIGLMHTLFALEDLYGFKIDRLEGEVCIRLDKYTGSKYSSLFESFSAWADAAEKYRKGEISKDDYDKWRYYYPQYDDTQITAKVPSQKLSDALIDAFKDRIEERG
ncbi:MAG: helix-turn-helix transcriptional regulator [Clostridia bacterium]|nr:helix-turn-helix transcriptional regulator [Clostridia bacterium]